MGRGSGDPHTTGGPRRSRTGLHPPHWRHPGALWRKPLAGHCVGSDGHGRSQASRKEGVSQAWHLSVELKVGQELVGAPIHLYPLAVAKGYRTQAELLALGFLSGPFPSPEASDCGGRVPEPPAHDFQASGFPGSLGKTPRASVTQPTPGVPGSQACQAGWGRACPSSTGHCPPPGLVPAGKLFPGGRAPYIGQGRVGWDGRSTPGSMNRGLLWGWVTRTQHGMSQVDKAGPPARRELGQGPTQGHSHQVGPHRPRRRRVPWGRTSSSQHRLSEVSRLWSGLWPLSPVLPGACLS